MEPEDIQGDDRSQAVIATVCVCLAITTIMVIVRLYTRVFLVKQVGPDDYLATITLILISGLGISLALNARHGLGRHMSNLAESHILLFKKYFYATLLFYTTALLSVKTTLLTQYYRLFSVQSRIRTLYVSAFILVIAWSLSQVFLAVLACTPVPAFWNSAALQDGSGARCLPPLPLLYANAAGNIATEVAVLVLPLPVLGNLNLPKSQRSMLVGVFSLGFLTVIISIIRIRHLDSLSDYTYQAVTPALLSLAELTTALTCACLLTLRPIITRTSQQHQVYQQSHKRGDYIRYSGGSTTIARSSYSSQQPQPQHSPRRSQTPPRRGSAAIRYLASMESREGLYDDKYMLTASSYELENFPTPSPTASHRPSSPPPLSPPPAVVISPKSPTHTRRHSRTTLLPPPTRPKASSKRRRSLVDRPRFFWSSASDAERSRQHCPPADDWIPGRPVSNGVRGGAQLTSTVTTEIDSHGAAVKLKGQPTPKWEIGVQTTVYQTYQSTYLTTAVR